MDLLYNHSTIETYLVNEFSFCSFVVLARSKEKSYYGFGDRVALKATYNLRCERNEQEISFADFSKHRLKKQDVAYGLQSLRVYYFVNEMPRKCLNYEWLETNL